MDHRTLRFILFTMLSSSCNNSRNSLLLPISYADVNWYAANILNFNIFWHYSSKISSIRNQFDMWIQFCLYSISKSPINNKQSSPHTSINLVVIVSKSFKTRIKQKVNNANMVPENPTERENNKTNGIFKKVIEWLNNMFSRDLQHTTAKQKQSTPWKRTSSDFLLTSVHTCFNSNYQKFNHSLHTQSQRLYLWWIEVCRFLFII